MNLLHPSYRILSPTDGILEIVERAARCCYKSECKIAEGTAAPLVRSIIKRGHESVIEHATIMVHFCVDRGVSHELVRHRIASYSQESTRYCDYSPDGRSAGLNFIIPPWIEFQPGDNYGNFQRTKLAKAFAPEDLVWYDAMIYAEETYNRLRSMGWEPQQARAILPNSLKTEIVATLNLRSWRNCLRLRTAPEAHPQMQQVMRPLLDELKARVPVIFDDLGPQS